MGRAALGLVAGSVALVWITALLGPSVAEPPLGGDPTAPPFRLQVDPEPWLVVALLTAAYAAGTAGLLAALRALARGWRPSPRRLLAGGAVGVLALVAVPPVGSADHLSYAAYGRIAVAGGDPYAVRPVDWRGGTDPVVAAVEEPWEFAPSVYGPVATAEQALASALGGESVAATVWWLSVLGGAAFLGAGILLVRTAGPDPAARARAALLWTANPLLLALLVAGAHADGLAVAWAVAGLAALRRSPLAAGMLLGAAAGTKLPLALLGLAAAWALRRRAGALARLAGGAALLLGPAFALAGPDALDQVRRAARYVSLATPWNLVVDPLDGLLGETPSRRLVGLGAAGGAVLVALALHRIVPPAPEPPDPALGAARAGAVLVAAWLLTAPYSLPWYDAALWAPLALLPPSRLDPLALARTATMALAYVPGRVELPERVGSVSVAWRGEVTPWLGLLLVLLVLAIARRAPAVGAERTRSRSAPAR